jgi:uncharacterized RDD family membrane protein YckC
MASAEYSVLTPERVNLQYDIAGVGSRGAAVIVDSTIQAVALTVVVLGLAGALAAGGLLGINTGDDEGILGSLVMVGFVLAVFAVTNGYFMLFEILWNGQTPGKRLVGVRVIRENGYPLRPVDAVVRNLVRIVDWLPFLYACGIVTMLLNNRARRLGDFASGTIVIREGPRALASLMSPVPTSAAPMPQRVTLSSSDATLVRDFLVRRGMLNAIARSDLAQRLAAVLSQRYGVALDRDPEQFLEQLAS